METKRCKYCMTNIPKKAKVCPQCGRSQGGKIKWIIIAIVLIMIGSASIGRTREIFKDSDEIKNEKNDMASLRASYASAYAEYLETESGASGDEYTASADSLSDADLSNLPESFKSDEIEKMVKAIKKGDTIKVTVDDSGEVVSVVLDSDVAKSESVNESSDENTETDYTDGMDKATKNAYKSAKNYLSFAGFSKQGLIDQLSSEYGDKFTVEQATAAVQALEDNGEVDWNEQAVRTAEAYDDFTSFSREGLIRQLSSEYGNKFTVEQATYAADQLGF